MPGTLDDRYFEWLYGIIGSVRNRNPARTHWELARQLYVKEFIWIVPNDDNRIEDGKDLRDIFLKEHGIDEVDQEWLDLGCSMLEMLIALSQLASFDDIRNRTPAVWFGIFLRNIGLDTYNDKVYNDRIAQQVDETLDLVIYRHYDSNGNGGLFPLKHPERDQRHVELWYQMSAYLIEDSLT